MELLQRVLAERADELADEVRSRTGLSRSEATRLVEEAGDHLIASYRWRSPDLSEDRITSPTVARDLLEGISGRAVAEKVGLPADRTWDGIRAFVPAVLASAARRAERVNGGGESRSGGDSEGFDAGLGLHL